MFIKIGQQQWINTQFIETICVAGKNEVRVYMINSDNFYKCAGKRQSYYAWRYGSDDVHPQQSCG